MALRSTLLIDLSDADLAKKLVEVLAPEAASAKSKSSKVSVESKGRSLSIEIEAPTVASLRALLNSYIRWISTSLDVVCLKGD
jgi:tRNA threonylcarbamoyladenosine modification (KEOPS) complex  Pcc1 subunit